MSGSLKTPAAASGFLSAAYAKALEDLALIHPRFGDIYRTNLPKDDRRWLYLGRVDFDRDEHRLLDLYDHGGERQMMVTGHTLRDIFALVEGE